MGLMYIILKEGMRAAMSDMACCMARICCEVLVASNCDSWDGIELVILSPGEATFPVTLPMVVFRRVPPAVEVRPLDIKLSTDENVIELICFTMEFTVASMGCDFNFCGTTFGMGGVGNALKVFRFAPRGDTFLPCKCCPMPVWI